MLFYFHYLTKQENMVTQYFLSMKIIVHFFENCTTAKIYFSLLSQNSEDVQPEVEYNVMQVQ